MDSRFRGNDGGFFAEFRRRPIPFSPRPAIIFRRRIARKYTKSRLICQIVCYNSAYENLSADFGDSFRNLRGGGGIIATISTSYSHFGL